MAFKCKDLMIDVLPERLWAGGCNVGTCQGNSLGNSDCPNPSCVGQPCPAPSCKGSRHEPHPKPHPKRAAAAHLASLQALRRQLQETVDRV